MTGHRPGPFVAPQAWAPLPPRPVQLVPATGQVELRGRRVVVGLPGTGWRGDLRADQRVTQNSRTYVPVLPEGEWYRAESELVEMFAPLVPIEQIWVEKLGHRPTTGTSPDTRPVFPGGPTPPRPTPVVEAGPVTGRRVVQVVGPAERRDLRAVSEPYPGSDGDIHLRVMAELDWYRWAWRGALPSTIEVPAHLLWTE
ncbi:hypothetical protein O7606_22045 [Micromonospora sp. WMMD882]|uniref:hypothetical protein n=1 Tax=Micromonospora sp. WMMD882 TaxID=3015151 RepID=UPI00248C6C70|nr:hypothetical protein [Micromonospora sp. WMMD882]WBB78856.1 hypothetical protein O7606_22045 [Micromonospora sp. WMMD882]